MNQKMHKINKLNRKGDMSVAILFFLVLTAGLFLYALFSFYTYNTRVNQTFYSTKVIDSVYSEEAELNFFLDGVFNKVINDPDFLKGYTGSPESLKQIFVSKFGDELKKYAKKNGDYPIYSLKYLVDNLNVSDVSITDTNLIYNAKTIIIKYTGDSGVNQVSVTYYYKKRFEKSLTSPSLNRALNF